MDRDYSAERAFVSYDFEPQRVKDTGAWNEVERDRWERKVYLEDDLTPDGDSDLATFVVIFAPGGDFVLDSYVNYH